MPCERAGSSPSLRAFPHPELIHLPQSFQGKFPSTGHCDLSSTTNIWRSSSPESRVLREAPGTFLAFCKLSSHTNNITTRTKGWKSLKPTAKSCNYSTDYLQKSHRMRNAALTPVLPQNYAAPGALFAQCLILLDNTVITVSVEPHSSRGL